MAWLPWYSMVLRLCMHTCWCASAGEGRVHVCLRFHRDQLTEACRNEETKLAAREYRDIRLRPKLNKLCSEEKAVYCKVGLGGDRDAGRSTSSSKVLGKHRFRRKGLLGVSACSAVRP